MLYQGLSGRPMTDHQISLYLRRLQLGERPLRPDLNGLRLLQNTHLRFIPYENFDCLHGKCATLRHSDMFRKIILHNRGGICFELNGLYNWLLCSLGFTVTSFAARFIDKLAPYQLRRHRLLCVSFGDERYISDVGVVKESPRVPLLLEEEKIQDDGVSSYKFTKDPFFGWLLWQKEPRKPWKTVLGFTEEPQLDKDFILPSFWCDAHPDSPFNKHKLLSIFREDCNININRNYLKFYLGGRVKYRYLIKNGQELKSVLWEYFGVSLDYPLKNEGMDEE